MPGFRIVNNRRTTWLVRSGVAALLAIAALGLVKLTASAEPSASIAPSVISVERALKSGATVDLPPLRVVNRGDQPALFQMHASRVARQSDLAPDADAIRFDPRSFDLEPGAARLVELRLKVPREAAGGSYSALLMVVPQSTASTPGVLGVTAGVATTLRYTVEAHNGVLFPPVVDWFIAHTALIALAVAGLAMLGVMRWARSRFTVVARVPRRKE